MAAKLMLFSFQKTEEFCKHEGQRRSWLFCLKAFFLHVITCSRISEVHCRQEENPALQWVNALCPWYYTADGRGRVRAHWVRLASPQSFLLDALKSTLIPFSSHLILHQQQAALVADAYHQKWNISCCHAAVCSGAVARTGCFGVHPWISPSWVPVHSWGVGRLPDLSTAHCVFGCTPKGGEIPPKIQLYVGKGWNSASWWPQASWDQPSLALVLHQKVMENRQEGISCWRSVSFRYPSSIQRYTCAEK